MSEKNKANKALKLKNYFFTGNSELRISSLQDWLAIQTLHGKESRSRTRFLKLIGDRVVEVEKERGRMLEEHAEKRKVNEETDEGGKKVKKEVEKIVFFDEEGKETIDPQEGKSYKLKDTEKFSKELESYLIEDCVIDITPATSEIVYMVRDIVLNTQEEFSNWMASRYDEWATAFESIGK